MPTARPSKIAVDVAPTDDPTPGAAPEVRRDFGAWFDRAVPEGASYWTHTLEGDDDMPAHIKAALLGPSLTLPLSDGRPALGTWQGIYLCEHRDHGGPRALVATFGPPAASPRAARQHGFGLHKGI